MHKHTANTRTHCGVLSAALVLVCLLRAAHSEAQGYTITDLGTLGGTFSRATAVSNGQVVGLSLLLGNAAGHAFSWTQEGGIVDLGTLVLPSPVSVIATAMGRCPSMNSFRW